MKKIALFASGTGTNADNIISYCNVPNVKYEFKIFSNNPKAKVFEVAKKNNVDSFLFSKTELENGLVLEELKKFQPDLIVLAGFLLKFPTDIIENYPDRIINIHPALLPKYGGKGMYGINVHQAVLDNKEKESGITIHFVNENYDEGKILFQKEVSVMECTNAIEISKKVQELEYLHFPIIIEQLLNKI